MKPLTVRLKLGLLALVLLGVAAGGFIATRYHEHDTTRGGTDQCSLPVSQRTGGWICP